MGAEVQSPMKSVAAAGDGGGASRPRPLPAGRELVTTEAVEDTFDSDANVT
jgi:hypothetical protein